ncbi:MAG TPA: DUF1592 domain-containing protein [Polyangiaceae bacterium]|nr:DUF1592 domain-containing protein [Polyangiaceae bacterium]
MSHTSLRSWSIAGFACLLELCACTGSISSPDGVSGRAAGVAGEAPSWGGGASATVKVNVPAGMRRLSASQYRTTVVDLFGSTIKLPTELDPDDGHASFPSVGSYRVTTSPSGVLKYEDAAYLLSEQVLAEPALSQKTFGCDPQQGSSCASSFVTTFGRRAWRRPLTEQELARYVGLIAETSKLLGSPGAGFARGLAAFLQSPHFLYLPEVGETNAGRLRLTSHELASRLAYLLTEGPPDAELAAAADRNELQVPSQLQAQLRRLLALPQARPALHGFFTALLGLAELDGLTKNVAVYPKASPTLLTAMRDEARALVDDNVFGKQGAMLDLLDAKSSFPTPELAGLYAGASDRAGILTSAAWLAIQAKPNRSSPTLRGVWLRQRLLCQDVPSPPADVNNELVVPAAGAGTPGDANGNVSTTTRQALEMHRKNPSCAACHAFFDPLGVAFENFDGLGAYRASENGAAIDTSGDLDGKPFANSRELIALLKQDPRVGDCLVQQLFEFVSGHAQLPAAQQVVAQLGPAFWARPDFVELLTQMVTSSWFASPAAPL